MAPRRTMIRLPLWTWIIISLMLGLILAVPTLVPEPARSLLSDGPGPQPSDPGLDPQGGSRLLFELDFQAAVTERLETLADSLRAEIRAADRERSNRIGDHDLRISARGVSISLRNPAQTMVMRRVIDRVIEGKGRVDPLGMPFGQPADIAVLQDGGRFTLTFPDPALTAWRHRVIEQSIAVIRRRINELGVLKPDIRRQGPERILVQVPGLDDPQPLKDVLGTRAKLTFQMVQAVHPGPQRPPRADPGYEILPSVERTRAGEPRDYYTVQRSAPLSGDCLVSAREDIFTGMPVVSFRFDSHCARIFGNLTGQNVNRMFAIVLDGEVLSAPVIRDQLLGGSGEIAYHSEAIHPSRLALLLRAGALPAPLAVKEEPSVGPDPGRESIDIDGTAAGDGAGDGSACCR